jgi:hypothetical protein
VNESPYRDQAPDYSEVWSEHRMLRAALFYFVAGPPLLVAAVLFLLDAVLLPNPALFSADGWPVVLMIVGCALALPASFALMVGDVRCPRCGDPFHVLVPLLRRRCQRCGLERG